MSRLPKDAKGNVILPPKLALDPAAPQVHIRSYRLITPLFGGGVEPQQADPITTVRASAVRGQLRFWWRATRSGDFGANGLKEMKEQEDRLWGSTEHQSLVEIEVRKVDAGTLITTFDDKGRSRHIGDPNSPISYAAFPLRNVEDKPGKRRRAPGGLRFDVSFELAVTLPTDAVDREEILAAFWAWETFGGLGGRTRRGFGALRCDAVQGAEAAGPWLPPTADPATVEKWLHTCLQQYVISGAAPTGVPQLAREHAPTMGRSRQVSDIEGGFKSKLGQLLTSGGYPGPVPAALLRALIAWYYPIDKLRAFRQSRRGNRGRSFWPEPDEIRRQTTGFRGRHAELSKTRKFPRAVFGLPIVFQFKDAGDPPPTTLQGEHHERMASRLILRPLACNDGNFASVATLLVAPALPDGGKLKLVEGKQSGTPVSAAPLTKPEASFPPLNGTTDVIAAFLATL